jgi:hypothetical protein
MTMADIWLTTAARTALESLPSDQADAVSTAIRHIPSNPGRPLNLPGAPPAQPFLAVEPEDRAAPVVIYRHATPLEDGDWLVVSLMPPADYRATRHAEQTLASAPPAAREGVTSVVRGTVSAVGDKLYSDQLIKALQQMRAQAIGNAADPGLPGMLLDAMGIAVRWTGVSRPPPPPAGADNAQIDNYTRQYADALGLEEGLMGALHTIERSGFAVEAIDNAIRVAESRA